MIAAMEKSVARVFAVGSSSPAALSSGIAPSSITTTKALSPRRSHPRTRPEPRHFFSNFGARTCDRGCTWVPPDVTQIRFETESGTVVVRSSSPSLLGAWSSSSGRGLPGAVARTCVWSSAISFAWLKLSIREPCGGGGDMLCRQATWYPAPALPSRPSTAGWPRAISRASHCSTLYTRFIQYHISFIPLSNAYYCARRANAWVPRHCY